MAELYPWQQIAWMQLAGRARHAHAYLLHGPAGIGKRVFAERLMALFLCQSPDQLQPCGRCKACLLLAAGTHPDHYILQPDEADKAIRVDQVRELVDFVTQTAQLGGRKVVLLEPVEAMNLNAANALLKSLEEPSASTQLLLVSHQPSRLLPTIKSRCVQFACPLPSAQRSVAWLAEMLPGLAAEQCAALLELSGNSPLKARQLHEEGVIEQRERVVEGIKQLLKQKQSPSQLAESWNSLPLVLLFDWFCQWSLSILRYQMTGDETSLGAADMAKVVQYLAQKAPRERVLEMQQWLLLQRNKVIGKANLNRILLLESLLVQWATLPGPG